MSVTMWCTIGLLALAQSLLAETPAPVERPTARFALPVTAVAEALAAAGLPVAADRLHLPGAVSTHAEAPQLEITAAEQRANGSLMVRIACHSPVDCMPFFATVDAGEDRAAIAAFAARRFLPAREPARSATASVAVGARVTLQFVDNQMRIQMPAIAIDTGVPGAEVRVSSLDRKHTWRGVVVDATTVRGGVQ